MLRPRATIDFETRSKADLRKVGQRRYAQDPSTQIIVLKYRLPGQEDVRTWYPMWVAKILGVPRLPAPTDLWDWIASGGLVEAHNAGFEKAIWREILVQDYLWPDIPNKQWRCSAAKAASYALPRSLDGAIEARGGTVKKDKEGHRLMMKMAKPRKPTKNNPSEWNEDAQDILRLFDYCAQDVRAEEAFSHGLPDLMDVEQEIWEIDQDINERGLPVDMEFVEKAIEILNQIKEEYNAQIAEITDGQVTKITQRNALKTWCAARGVDLEDTKAITLDAVLEPDNDFHDDAPVDVKRVLLLVRQAGRASTAKYKAIQNRCSSGNRVRDILVYAGASRTSRWAGAGFQPQNLPRGIIKDTDRAIDLIMAADDLDDIEEEYPDLFSLFSSVLRGAIVASEGMELHCADYSAIEGRGVSWVSNFEEGLEIFRRFDAGKGPDVYLVMASKVYNIPVEQMDKKTHAAERQMGKVLELGCGYQLGGKKLVEYAKGYGIELTEKQARELVKIYRDSHQPIVDLWRACNECALEAMNNPGETIWVNDKIAYKRVKGFLFCRLPSGRLIPYPQPYVADRTTEFEVEVENEDGTVTIQKKKITRPCLHYYEINAKTKKWSSTATYGGKLVENIVQALCRDLMAHAMLVVERANKRGETDFEILLTVHDELVTQSPKGRHTYKELEKYMSILPKWAKGFPIAAEGWTGPRYKK